jgi:hypothetical protein
MRAQLLGKFCTIASTPAPEALVIVPICIFARKGYAGSQQPKQDPGPGGAAA